MVSKKKGWFSKLKDDVSDFGSAVKTSVSNVVSAAKESYQNHGTMYDVVEYGKAALKIGKGVVKIAGAVAAISTGVGIPIAICGIISAGNDIINAGTDIANIALDQYDEVGKTNYLKDLLKKNGGEMCIRDSLFIVIDEFAEFKNRFPEFMQAVNRVFAVGRTLGVHMILSLIHI